MVPFFGCKRSVLLQLLALCRERLAAKLARKEKERKNVAWEFRGHIIFYYIKRARAGLYRFITWGEVENGGARNDALYV